MDHERILQVRGNQIQVSEQCRTRPMHEVAVDVVAASSLACIRHTQHVLLAAADGQILAPWVNVLIEQTGPIESSDALSAYTGWLRSLALGHVATSSQDAAMLPDVDGLLHGLAYVEAWSHEEALRTLIATSSPLEALHGALAVLAATVGMHADATDQPWADACQQLLGLVE